MPYLDEESKELICKGMIPQTEGELNFAITNVVRLYIAKQREERGRVGYSTINEVLGALDGASKEFYRRIAIPYENKKIRENGDVYEGTRAHFDIQHFDEHPVPPRTGPE